MVNIAENTATIVLSLQLHLSLSCWRLQCSFRFLDNSAVHEFQMYLTGKLHYGTCSIMLVVSTFVISQTVPGVVIVSVVHLI